MDSPIVHCPVDCSVYKIELYMIQSNILTSWEAYLEPNSTDTEQYNIAQNHTHYHDDRDIILRQEQLTPPIPTHWVPLLKGLRPVLVAEVAMIFIYV